MLLPQAISRSIRARLLLWFAGVLSASIIAFALLLYLYLRGDRFHQIDQRLITAAQFLESSLSLLPRHELEGAGPRRPLETIGAAQHRSTSDRGERSDGSQDRVDRPARVFFGPGPPPPRGDRPPHDFGPPPPGEQNSFAAEPKRLPGPVDLPAVLVEGRERVYYAAWRADGSLLASTASDEITPPARSEGPPRFAWRPGFRREAVLTGPRGTTILVGRPVGGELAALSTFGWQALGGGALILAIGLSGARWIARGLTAPIASIANTASAISATSLAGRIDVQNVDFELRELAAVLNDAFARLQAAFERQARFTADASHELRTPLSIVHSNLQLALARPRSPEEYHATLETCGTAVVRMTALVNGLLTLARADAGRLDLSAGPIDLSELLKETAAQYASALDGGDLKFVTSIPDGATTSGDAALLAQAIGNLLSNAIRYTPPGGEVRLTLRFEPSFAVVTVEDSGCGIAPEYHDRLFERFFRVDAARSRRLGGNGLGLAICKSLIEAHGGDIRFSSAQQQGTTFSIRLPLQPEQVGSAQPPLPACAPRSLPG